MILMTRLMACSAVLALAAACASPSGSNSSGVALPPVWAVGPDRLLELDPNAKVSTNILPMYAGTDRSEGVLAKADRDFITQTSAAFGGRANASKDYSELGLKYYDENRYEKAMMRLNQAWLLDETNPDVFYGFAAVYQDHQNYLEAGDFASKSLELGQEDPVRVADCAYMVAAQMGARANSEGRPSDAQVAQIQAQLRPILSRALDSAAPADRAYVQLIAFKTQMITVDYDGAWRSADALEAMGEEVPESYRTVLEKHPR